MSNPTLKTQLLLLHPDFNGGDTSRIGELVAFMKSWRAQAIENKTCLAGCGRKVAHKMSSPSVNKKKQFCGMICHRFFRFYRNKLAMASLVLIMGCSVFSQPVPVAWNPAPNADGYILFHYNPNALPDMYSTGNATNYTLDVSQLSIGVNYLAVCAFQETYAGLMISTYSNIAVVTNTPELVLNSIVFSSSNLTHWSPYYTNHLRVMPDCAGQFFITGSETLTATNVISAPKP